MMVKAFDLGRRDARMSPVLTALPVNRGAEGATMANIKAIGKMLIKSFLLGAVL